MRARPSYFGVGAAYAAELSEALRASIPELRNFMDWAQDDPSAEDAVGEFLAICDRDWIADRAYNFHVFLADSDALIGNCALMRRVGPVAIEIGYWIRSDHAGRGYATEAAGILVEAAWGIDSIERIVIRHDLANGASGRVAESSVSARSTGWRSRSWQRVKAVSTSSAS